MSGGEFPKADAVARAVVHAALCAGQLELLRAGLEGGALPFGRWRWPVLYAVHSAYPDVALETVCRWLDCPPDRAFFLLAKCIVASWWSWPHVMALFRIVTEAE